MNTQKPSLFTLPNILTGSRLLIIPIILLLLIDGRDLAAAVVFSCAAVTDFFDGWLARRAGSAGATFVGRVLDPLADRLMLSGVAVTLAVRGSLSVWVVAVLVGRDIAALVGATLFRGKISVNKMGKAATAVLMTSVALIIFTPGRIGETLFYIGIGLSLISGLMYIDAVRDLKRALPGSAPRGKSQRSRRSRRGLR